MVLGMRRNPMDLEKQSITTEMCTKDNLWKDSDVEMEPISSIKFISILDNGNTIVFGEKANFIKMMKSSFKAYLKKDWSMVKANINIKMEISLKEIILRMKKGERGNTISVRVAF